MASEYQRSARRQWGNRRDQGKMSTHYLRDTWRNMNARCGYLPDYHKDAGTNAQYRDEVEVFPAWRAPDGFPAFAKWITENLGDRPDGYTLDRIDPFGHYEPGNLQWASRAEQRLNIQENWLLWTIKDMLIGHDGTCERSCLCDWQMRQDCNCAWAIRHALADDDHLDCSEPQAITTFVDSDTTCDPESSGCSEHCPLRVGCTLFFPITEERT